MSVKVEFENDRVRVLRARHSSREQHAAASRGDRVIIYLSDGHVRRKGKGAPHEGEEIHRKSGDVVWRGRSEHQIENLEDANHEVIIVELK